MPVVDGGIMKRMVLMLVAAGLMLPAAAQTTEEAATGWLAVDVRKKEYFIMQPPHRARRYTGIAWNPDQRAQFVRSEQSIMVLSRTGDGSRIMRHRLDGTAPEPALELADTISCYHYAGGAMYYATGKNIYRSADVTGLFYASLGEIVSLGVFPAEGVVAVAERHPVKRVKNKLVDTAESVRLYLVEMATGNTILVDEFIGNAVYSPDHGMIVYEKRFDLSLNRRSIMKIHDVRAQRTMVTSHSFLPLARGNFFISRTMMILGAERSSIWNDERKMKTSYSYYDVEQGTLSKLLYTNTEETLILE
jgi:hypothetical protein